MLDDKTAQPDTSTMTGSVAENIVLPETVNLPVRN